MNDNEIERMLNSLKSAPRIPQARRDAAFERVRAEWQAQLRERTASTTVDVESQPLRRRWSILALAASVVLAVAVGLFHRSSNPPAMVSLAATVTAVSGRSELETGATIPTSRRISTGDATIAAVLPSGLNLRMAPNSVLVFATSERVVLERGRIYVDSGPTGKKDPLVIETGLGDVRHIGTQYLVTRTDESVIVAVREGSVALLVPRGTQSLATASAGEQLQRTPDGRTRRLAVSSTDSLWRWVEQVPATLEVEGLELGTFLSWYGRETGRRVNAMAIDSSVILHGSIAGMTPDEALEAIAAAVELEITREAEQVVIEKR